MRRMFGDFFLPTQAYKRKVFYILGVSVCLFSLIPHLTKERNYNFGDLSVTESIPYVVSLIFSLGVSVPITLNFILDFLTHDYDLDQGFLQRGLVIVGSIFPDLIILCWIIPNNKIQYISSLTAIRSIIFLIASFAYLAEYGGKLFQSHLFLSFSSLHAIYFLLEPIGIVVKSDYFDIFILIFEIILFAFYLYFISQLYSYIRSKSFTIEKHILSTSITYLLCTFTMFLVLTISKLSLQFPNRGLGFQELLISRITALIFFLVVSKVRSRTLRAQVLATNMNLERKRIFVRLLSHEMRTPLSIVVSGITYIRKTVLKHPDILSESELLDTIHETQLACDSTITLLDDLLTYEKLDADVLRLEREDTDVLTFVGQAVHPFFIQARQRDIVLEITTSTSTEAQLNQRTMSIDPVKLHQAMRHILHNAVKFTASGGSVKVVVQLVTDVAEQQQQKSHSIFGTFKTQGSMMTESASRHRGTGGVVSVGGVGFTSRSMDEARRINDEKEKEKEKEKGTNLVSVEREYVVEGDAVLEASSNRSPIHNHSSRKNSAYKNNNNNNNSSFDGMRTDCHYVRIDVIDTGIGINGDDLHKIFQEFVQFKAGKLKAGGGSGLGLWLTKAIIDLHGGKILVNSEGLGRGTTFSVLIPLNNPLVTPMLTSNNNFSSLFRSVSQRFVVSGKYSGCSETTMNGKIHPEGRKSLERTVDVVSVAARDTEKVSVRNFHSQKVDSDKVNNSNNNTTNNRSMKFESTENLITMMNDHKLPSQNSNNHNNLNHDEIDDGDDSHIMAVHKRLKFQTSSSSIASNPTLNRPVDLHALIVDDSHICRRMVKRALRDNFSSIVEAEDGLVAVTTYSNQLAVPEEERINVILMDYQMPNMDGATASKKIREMGYKGLILGITGNALPEDLETFCNHGVNQVLTKPYDMSTLENILTDYAWKLRAASKAQRVNSIFIDDEG